MPRSDLGDVRGPGRLPAANAPDLRGARPAPPVCFSMDARAGAICTHCKALFDGPNKPRVANRLAEHLHCEHGLPYDKAAARALVTELCECGRIGTVRLASGAGYICAGCDDKQRFHDWLVRDESDYGRPMREADLDDDDDHGNAIAVHDWPSIFDAA